MDRVVWVGLPTHLERDARKRLLTTAVEQGFLDVVLDPRDEEFLQLAKFNPIFLKDGTLEAHGEEVGRYVTLKRGEDERAARALRGQARHLVIAAEDWKVIPLENLIAHFQGSGTRLIMTASTAPEAKLFLETMEVGADGVLLMPKRPQDIVELRSILEARESTVPLVHAKVKGIRQLGLGDRVCVDTCSMLAVGEGMLVGNSAQGLFLIHSESIESEYVASRPFRVNAGAVHAYVLLPDGRTKYLSELRAGDEVLAVDRQGRSRVVIVGRSKVERRPLLLVEAEAEGRGYGTIVQNAETIRLVTPEGYKAVPQLKPGDTVLVRREDVGRHFGMPMKETIQEK